MVVPRPLTLGVLVRALIATGLDESDAFRADTPTCIALLDVLCEDVVLPKLEDKAVWEMARDQWNRMLAHRIRAQRIAEKLAEEAEAATGERAPEAIKCGRHKLIRTLSVLSPTERAAVMCEPLDVALAFLMVGAVQRAADDVKEKALRSGFRLN